MTCVHHWLCEPPNGGNGMSEFVPREYPLHGHRHREIFSRITYHWHGEDVPSKHEHPGKDLEPREGSGSNPVMFR